MEYRKHPERNFRHLIAAPFIYGICIPLVLFDFSLEVYHRICFSLYGLPLIKRGDYIKMDRHRLQYLEWYDKINCAYCGYANGLVGYAVAIAGATEKYWCGIKHQPEKNFHVPAHQRNFVEFGDQKAFEEKYINTK